MKLLSLDHLMSEGQLALLNRRPVCLAFGCSPARSDTLGPGPMTPSLLVFQVSCFCF